jgi:hypothetical protein
VTGNPKTDALNVGIDGSFTVGDFLRQPGNVFDIDTQYADAKARGASSKELNALLATKDKILASDLATHPEVRAYLAATDQLKYADGSYKAPSGGGSSTYRAPSKKSGSFVPYSAAERAAYGRSLGGKSSGSTASPSASSANTFFTEYKALTKGTPEYKAAVADPTVRDLLSASAAKTATPAMYDAATTALRDAVAKARSGGATGSNGVTAPAGTEAATIAAGPGTTAASKDAYYTALVRASMDKAGERLYGTSLPNLSHAQALALFNAVQAGGNSGYTPGAGTKAAVTGYSAPTKATTATGYVPYTAAQRAAYGTQFTRAQKAAYGASKKGVAA